MKEKRFTDANFTEVASAMALAAMLSNAETVKVFEAIAKDRCTSISDAMARTAIRAAKALTSNL